MDQMSESVKIKTPIALQKKKLLEIVFRPISTYFEKNISIFIKSSRFMISKYVPFGHQMALPTL